MRCFLVFQQGRANHSFVTMVRADSLLDAICRWLMDHDDDLVFGPDGAVSFVYEDATISYPHPLACVEAIEKSAGEWSIHELPAWVLEEDCAELFVGEHPGEVEDIVRICREAFRKHRGVSNARAFIWYLRDGVLVTFYKKNKKKRPFQINVVKRCYLRWEAGGQVVEWKGDYEELLEKLWLMPAWWARRREVESPSS